MLVAKVNSVLYTGMHSKLINLKPYNVWCRKLFICSTVFQENLLFRHTILILLRMIGLIEFCALVVWANITLLTAALVTWHCYETSHVTPDLMLLPCLIIRCLLIPLNMGNQLVGSSYKENSTVQNSTTIYACMQQKSLTNVFSAMHLTYKNLLAKHCSHKVLQRYTFTLCTQNLLSVNF